MFKPLAEKRGHQVQIRKISLLGFHSPHLLNEVTGLDYVLSYKMY